MFERDKKNTGNKYTLIEKYRSMNNLLSNKIFNDGHKRSGKKNLYIRKHSNPLFLIILFLIMLIKFAGCEAPDRFYRPDMPEKLCCIGIIDADNTINDSLLAFPYGLKGNLHSISFEKSYQSEYPEEVNDSLRGFSFSLSTSGEEELLSYSSDSIIKELSDFHMPGNIEFRSGETYYLKASEDSSPEITAKITVPEPPPVPELIAYSIERTTLSEPLPCTGITEIRTAVLDVSFNNQGKNNYYAVVIFGEGFSFHSSLVHLYDYLDFTVRDSNYPGFYAILHGLKKLHSVCIEDESRMNIEESPVYAYFIDGNEIPDNNYRMTICIQHSDSRCVYECFKSLNVNLLSIPEELYLFEKSLYTYNRVSDDPFSEPLYLNGNIQGGNGLFAICRSKELVVDINMEDYFFKNLNNTWHIH